MSPFSHAGAAAIAVLTASALLSAPASACKCLPPPPPAVHYQQADAAFAGVVLRVEDHPGRDRPVGSESPDALRTSFLVTAVWKGDLPDTVAVISGRGGGDCGYLFEPGTRYLVYATRQEGALSTSICTRTARFDAALEDRVSLGDPVRVTPVFEYRLPTGGISD